MPRGRRSRRTTARSNPIAGRNRRNRETLPTVSIKSVDLLWNQNQEKHETDSFESPNHLVLRRGFTFDFIIEISNHEGLNPDLVKLELRRGYRARISRGTLFQAICGGKSRRHYQWKMEVVSSTNGEVRYRVHTPPDVPVGSYRCHVRVPLGKNKSKGERVWEDKKEIVFLFNPWNKDDSVYLPNERERNEYINNETGLIWAGTHDSTFTWPWNFAQFEVISLETVLYMLDSWRLGSDARRSPIHVTRCLANMVNNNDGDSGALIGLWSSNDDDYADGTSPTSWSGSEAILTQYMSDKKPVRYAQCWVFGGTLTTVLRTIGIPSRPVTNFESAHDADFNRAIDYYFDRNDKMIEDKSNDSIWNYHVWVEAWMTRPDLDGDYGGWQAVDATPQELSPHSRTMVVGPASIQAIKDGKDLKYDNEFVIAEVNADIKYHVEKSDGSFAVVSRHETKVGKHISTKAVGRNSREDVTSHYKYPEGSASERAALMGGSGQEEEEKRAVSFSAKLTSGRRIGEDLTFGVTAKIDSPISGNINVTAVFETTTYTGVVGKEIKKSKSILRPNNNATVDVTFVLKATEYRKHLGEQPLISVTILGYVEEPEQAWVHKIPVNLELPELTINIDGKGDDVKLKSGRTVSVKVTLKNPLKNESLTNVTLHIEGTGLIGARTLKSANVPSNGSITNSFSITPRSYCRVSERNYLTLIVTGRCNQLKGLMGTGSVEVVP
ncbi:PREDICTED: protein-glutamine gamma-glutamyltransferase K-like isoform X4 [Amphimedon queenslandica]|uniref:Transglutaminase-like domain-containing protein n=1 Tax=Amphimedon queenslandica TaxID=400682 RepID=A0AAN0J9Y4_AMPQE|nr:PREDICTED: protein-glutamine gamma-glutamyltransferase K-like isoform X4 [Amphimedon queenslandica]|eukprot:XP_019853850.1 PREDICTED: protein-glutamine gamma-glutamyltransferase K-like isoform X4 [Amphimedon queenslandica]